MRTDLVSPRLSVFLPREFAEIVAERAHDPVAPDSLGMVGRTYLHLRRRQFGSGKQNLRRVDHDTHFTTPMLSGSRIVAEAGGVTSAPGGGRS